MYVLLTGGNPFETVSRPIIALVDSALFPALGIVGTLGTIFCIFLGVKLAKADEPQEREKAKTALQNALTGFLLIFVLIVALKIGMTAMQTWMNANANITP